MVSNFSRADGATPIITFLSMAILGIVISEYIITEPKYKLFIILFSLFMGMILAGMEFRAIIGRRKGETKSRTTSKLTAAKKEEKLAKYVADLFEEDIEFNAEDEELDNQSNNVSVSTITEDRE